LFVTALQNNYSALYSKVPHIIKNNNIYLKLNNRTFTIYNISIKYCISYSYTPKQIEYTCLNNQVKYT